MTDERMCYNDLPEFVVTGETKQLLIDTLDIGFCVTGHSTAVGWKATDSRMVLYWASDGSLTRPHPFIVPMSGKDVAESVWAWLQTLSRDVFPQEYDHDGGNNRGWKVYTEAWGQISGDTYAFLAIEPHWMVCGK